MIGLFGKRAIRMQKQQHGAGGNGCACIHLRRAAARGALGGEQVFVAERPFAIGPALQQSGLDQRFQPSGQHVWRDPEVVGELVAVAATVTVPPIDALKGCIPLAIAQTPKSYTSSEILLQLKKLPVLRRPIIV